MNWQVVFTALGAGVFGLVIAYINMRISKKNLNAENMAAVMGVNMLRLLLDAAALAIVFFVCRALEASITSALIATALGLSVGGMLFLRSMVRKTQFQDNKGADGGEND